jgi:hypothetical protein
MVILHEQCHHFISCDRDAFIEDTPADLITYLAVATALQVKNWLNVWIPFILYSIKQLMELSLQQGINTLPTYFLPQDNVIPNESSTSHRPINNRSHHTAHPCLRARPVLPQPSFRWQSLCSFFGINHRQSPS